MPRPLAKIQKTHVTCQLPAALVERLAAYCSERGVSRTSVIEIAVLRFLVQEGGR